MKKIINLENLIYLTIFLLPTYLFRFSFFGISMNFLDILLGVNIFWGVAFLWQKKGFGEFFAKNRTLIFLVGLITLGFSVSIFFNENRFIGLGQLKSLIILPPLFFLAVRLAIDQKSVLNVFMTYYFSAFLVAVICLGYYFLGILTYDFRLEGFFNSPNYLGMYLAPAVFVFPVLFSRSVKLNKLFVFLSGSSILLALYLTYSYASWLAIVGALIFIFAFTKKIDWKKILAGVFLLGLLFFSQFGTDKFSDLFSNQSSFSSRIMIWRSAGKILNDNLLWGVGLGNFQTKYLEYQKYFSPYPEWAVPHPHNLYFSFWLFGGALGFFGFLALILFWFSGFLEKQKIPNLKFIGMGIMLYILFHGLVDTAYFKNDLAIIFWLLFALL